MRRPVLLTLVAVAALAGAATPAAAQRPALTPQQQMARDSLETRVRQRMGQMLRRELGLNDDQMRRLEATGRRFEPQRRELLAQEREVRLGLRRELTAGDSARQGEVAALLDRMLVLQRRRLDLLEAEQRELASYLTPVQRAKYFGMEENLRRRMEDLRDQGGRRPGMGTPRPAPGGRPGTARRPPAPK